GTEDGEIGRHWNKRVDFVRHLAGAMSSIADGWKRQFKEKNTFLASELSVPDEEGNDHSPLDAVPSNGKGVDQQLISKTEEDEILAIFKEDAVAMSLIQGLAQGLKKGDILLRYGLDEKRYMAAVRRIRTKLLVRENRLRGKNNE